MTTIKARIKLLERTIAAAVRMRPMPFVILRPDGDPSRAAALADIAERTKAGQRFITYKII